MSSPPSHHTVSGGSSGEGPPGRIVIVGAGLAGARCAETLRAEGYDGELVLVGDELHAPYERPALSKEFLAGRRGLDEMALHPHSFWADKQIDLRLGTRIAAVDRDARTATTDDGAELRWDVLVLATGARVRRLPFAGPDGVHFLRTADDALALREELVPGARLVVVGGGFVGAEVASTATALGVHVTMLESGLAPFARALGPEIGRLLAHRYRRHGVDLLLGVGAAGFRTRPNGRLESVVLSDGRDVACDTALVAVGVEQARELTAFDPEPPVYACGDVAGSRGHWTGAAAEAIAVARRILGLEPPPEQPPFFWSDQFGLRLQLVGEPSEADLVELEGEENEFVARYLAADRTLLAALAANRPAEVGRLRRELAFAA
jgi:3-phenylpropionate/trans-cinnamate dioxygenase ferredoxin reductase subunit